jgi:hypothetical protein
VQGKLKNREGQASIAFFNTIWLLHKSQASSFRSAELLAFMLSKVEVQALNMSAKKHGFC